MYTILKKLPAWVKSFYSLLGVAFLLWMTFFDSEDLITQYRLYRKRAKLEAEKYYYSAQIEAIKRNSEELENNKELLEKVAREKYLMRKKTEDLYIVVDP